MEFVDDADAWGGRREPNATIGRWRTAYQNAFEARMDWCVKPFGEANHEPKAALNGDLTLQVLEIAADPGAEVRLSATGSSDPDGDTLGHRWWLYREPSRYRGQVTIRDADAIEAVVAVPSDAAGRRLHIILEVTDDGTPPLTAYRRAIIRVSGQAPDRETKVTKLPPPPKETGPWAFYRGINVGGEPVTVDGNRWEGDDARDFACQDRKLHSPHVQLIPPTDDARAAMIHAFRWNRQARLTVSKVPAGKYAVYVYVWEETSAETIRMALNGKEVAAEIYTGTAGEWQRLGPWYVTVGQGTIAITTQGGAANVSGIEIWRAGGPASKSRTP
jgi:hypothetical protein